MANLEQPGSRMLDVYSVKLTFSLIATFFLQKLKAELKNLLRKLKTELKNL